LKSLSVLMLCDDNPGHANTVLHHINGLVSHSRHRIRKFNPRGLHSNRFLDLREFDVVVVHWSLVIISDHYLAPAFREKIAQFPGLKVQFLQDCYRWVDQIAEMMRTLGTDVLFTLVPEPLFDTVWRPRLPGVRLITTLAGYVPEELIGLPVPPIASRVIDIGYRGRTIPFHLGRLGQEKVWIGQGVLARAAEYGLRCDIAWRESDRIYGERWNEFIRSCRTVLGTESGVTIFDFDGSIERRSQDYLAQHPAADFEEVSREVLAPYENNVRLAVVSPRVFEAAAWRTGLIQFPGGYSNVVRPWDHYIPLERDFSNLSDVAELVRDSAFLERMTTRVYDEIIRSGRYTMREFVREFDSVIEEMVVTRAVAPEPRAKRPPMPWRFWLAHAWVAARAWLPLPTPRYWLARIDVAVSSPVVLVAQRLGEARARRLLVVVKGYLALRLVLSTKPLRDVLLYWVVHPTLWGRARFGPLMRDLLKVGIVRQSQRGTLTAGERFVVVARGVKDGRILLASQRPESSRPADFGWSFVDSAVRRGTPRLTWDHSAVGMAAWYRLHARKWIAVGSEGGRNELSGLDVIAEARPELIGAALRPPRPEDLQVGAVRSDVVLSPRALSKAYVGVWLLLTTPSTRGFVGRYLTTPTAWRSARIAAVLRDLSKLLAWHTAGGVASWRFDPATETLHLLSNSAVSDPDDVAAGVALAGSGLRRVTWDHSRFGPEVSVRAGGVIVRYGTTAAPHELDALPLLAQVMRREVWELLDQLRPAGGSIRPAGEAVDSTRSQ